MSGVMNAVSGRNSCCFLRGGNLLMGNCETCKWWNNPLRVMGTEWGDCNLATTDEDEPLIPTMLARAIPIGWETSRGVLETNAKFGCVQWEAKDA